jgi:citrate synthase
MNSSRTEPTPSGLISAAEAATRLGVSRATLYAYVSRGLVRSVSGPDDLRCRLYVSADVEMLVRQKTLTRGPSAASAAALNLGLPILETRVSGIIAGRLLYRGHDAIALAEDRCVEEVARILWETGGSDPFADMLFSPWEEPEWSRVAEVMKAASPTDRAQALLPLLTTNPSLLTRPRPFEGAACLVRAVANAATGHRLDPELPLHRALAQAWERPEAEDTIRRALVLSAEHELNPSTFTVRVVASTSATLAAALIAGLAALGGSRHSGLWSEFDAFYEEQARSAAGEPAILARISRENPPPGFGHPVYPDGDPRTAALMRHLDVPPPLARMTAVVEQATGLRPNFAIALWMLEKAYLLPPGSALALFAIGRSFGWIAHAIEQQTTNAVIRPRAKFIPDGKAVEQG